MLSPDDEYLTIEEATQKLYERISEYYDLQIQAIGPDEYAFIQQTIKYPESHEEHIAILRDAIRPENETREHITAFVTTYPEFAHPQYVAILDFVIKVLLTQPEKAKKAGIDALLSLQKTLDENTEQIGDDDDNDDDNDGADRNDNIENKTSVKQILTDASNAQIPEFIPFQIEQEIINLPSYQDPLMVSLYCVCFMAFSARLKSAINPTY